MRGMQRSSDVQATVIRMIMATFRLKPSSDVQVDTSSRLSDLGIDSMAKISLAFKLEEEFAVDLTLANVSIADIRTVGDVVSVIQDLLPKASDPKRTVQR